MNEHDNRHLIPGSEWLYAKIYTGSEFADMLLSSSILELVTNLLDSDVEQFFFIRYFDPHFHIRLRFKLISPEHFNSIISAIYKTVLPFIKTKQIWKIQYDTYDREIERYGLNTMDESESIFYYDSITTLYIIQLIRQNKIGARWPVALLLMDRMFQTFGLDLQQKYTFCEKTAIGYKKEFGIEEHNQQLNSIYRNQKTTVVSILESNNSSYYLQDIQRLIDEKTRHISPIVESIRLKTTKEQYYSLVSSYTHMMINRFFISDARKSEMILYDILTRYYKSKIARQEYNKE